MSMIKGNVSITDQNTKRFPPSELGGKVGFFINVKNKGIYL